ncbi:MAG TPA: hypothetical protein VHE30_03140 [Polyangiaceae bacterium]|nr:hypothetical protein [Polyangiaceae bacterium]
MVAGLESDRGIALIQRGTLHAPPPRMTDVVEAKPAEPIVERIVRTVDEARGEVELADRALQRFVRQRPLVAAVAALAVGFAVGRIVSRI